MSINFFHTEDDAIVFCRALNHGLGPKDERCHTIVPGPGCVEHDHTNDCGCADHAVVDLETARELLDADEDCPGLIVTG